MARPRPRMRACPARETGFPQLRVGNLRVGRLSGAVMCRLEE